MKDIFVVVPSYNPEEKTMTDFLKELKKEFKNILIINDGSDKCHNKFFKSLEEDYEVINNYKNLGKGRALKHATNYLLNTYPKLKGIVTCDCDGQHLVKDIKNVAISLLENDNSLILGVRDFTNKNVPNKSKYGNNITKWIFRTVIGLDITDTQTGLRGYSRNLMNEFLDILGERYEYETNILIYTKKHNINIVEVPIETVYINNNLCSHFNPIKDSYRIYKLFFKYFMIYFSIFVVDIILFMFFLKLFDNFFASILLATIAARIVSTIWGIVIDITKFKRKNREEMIIWTLFLLFGTILSGIIVSYMANYYDMNVLASKILIDLIIYFIGSIISWNLLKRTIYEKKKSN